MPKINQEEYEVLKRLDNKWKWVARDDDLSVYDDKPVKVHSVIPCWDTRTTKNEWQIINRNLLQFVQWRDENPYNIAELIEEYEYSTEHVSHVVNERVKALGKAWGEREETEVKDIEWLKERVSSRKKSAELNVMAHREGLSEDFESRVIAYESVLKLINQLDEPEVLSQKWIDKNKTSIYRKLDGTPIYKVKEELLQNLLVPKQDKPVIPQFVADYLCRAKADVTLMRVLEIANTRDELDEWKKEYDWISENDETFARAWLDGFTVEEEQKYILSINITDKASKTNYETFLNKRGIFHSMENESFNSEEFNWTEEEIKDLESGEILFEYFATKVEELEE